MPASGDRICVTVETALEDDRWDSFGLPALGQAACAMALNQFGLAPGRYEIDLLGCSDARIAALNRQFRGVGSPTNVLAWPAGGISRRLGEVVGAPDDTANLLGSIAVAWETCIGEAARAGKPPAHHVSHLLIHGCLHLVGCRHDTENAAAVMEELEVAALAALDIGNPYWT